MSRRSGERGQARDDEVEQADALLAEPPVDVEQGADEHVGRDGDHDAAGAQHHLRPEESCYWGCRLGCLDRLVFSAHELVGAGGGHGEDRPVLVGIRTVIVGKFTLFGTLRTALSVDS